MGASPAAAPRIISQVKAGEELGISRQRVQKLVKRWPEVEVDGGIDIERLKVLREQNADPLRQAVYQQQRKLKATSEAEAPPKPAATPKAARLAPEDSAPDLPLETADFNLARTRRERANAQLAELKAAQEAGKLIPRQEVQAREFAVARKLRDRILGFPARLQQFLGPEATKMLTEECDLLVSELQQDAARIAAEEF